MDPVQHEAELYVARWRHAWRAHGIFDEPEQSHHLRFIFLQMSEKCLDLGNSQMTAIDHRIIHHI